MNTKNVKETDMVYKSNHLVDARFKLSKIESYLILFAIVKWREKGIIDCKVSITVAEFTYFFSDVEKSNAYTLIQEAAENLFERSISGEINLAGGLVGVQKLRWIHEVFYIKGESRIELTFNKTVLEHIGRQEGSYLKYQIKNITKIKSASAIRIYELVLKELNKNKTSEVKIDIKFLKYMLMMENEYPRMTNFKERVIEPAIEQINAHTDLNLKYSNVKVGKVITHFLFKNIADQSKAKPVVEITKTDLINKLMSFGMTVKAAARIKDLYAESYILEHITLVQIKIEKADAIGKPVKNVGAYLVSALKSDWRPVESEFEKDKRKKVQEKAAKAKDDKENQAAEDAAKSAELRHKEHFAEAEYDKMTTEQKNKARDDYLNFLRARNQTDLIAAYIKNGITQKRVKISFLQWLADWLSK